MNTKQALELAIRFCRINPHIGIYEKHPSNHVIYGEEIAEKLEACKQALEQQAEPVAWRYKDSKGHYRYRGYVPNFDAEYKILKPIPLYTTSKPLKRLSVSDVEALLHKQGVAHDDLFYDFSNAIMDRMVEVNNG